MVHRTKADKNPDWTIIIKRVGLNYGQTFLFCDLERYRSYVSIYCMALTYIKFEFLLRKQIDSGTFDIHLILLHLYCGRLFGNQLAVWMALACATFILCQILDNTRMYFLYQPREFVLIAISDHPQSGRHEDGPSNRPGRPLMVVAVLLAYTNKL